jgi:tellurite methyltransferase
VSTERLQTWNQRYRERPDALGAPNPWIMDHVGVFPKAARILDLACGEGNNAVALAGQGFSVVGVDFSPVALERAQRFAARAGVEIETLREDLDSPSALASLGPIEGVVVTHYRPTSWEPIVRWLRRPGHVVVSCFNEEEHVQSGFPLAWCLHAHELYDVPGLRVVTYKRGVDAGHRVDNYVLARA